ncbi:hypothetical protein [Endozoicomonas sp. 8E]|uniref:hypothetical protein n=1 Tax=Endozoicomonas sp. 8E TaxID=3035692 RepID=UPI002938F61F|nr:hypothetical protein [Endozoicomonas sp. 8E]WOG29371.1 hypothetical protein P6910_06890 [Endozoicomonas sp. 8E]
MNSLLYPTAKKKLHNKSIICSLLFNTGWIYTCMLLIIMPARSQTLTTLSSNRLCPGVDHILLKLQCGTDQHPKFSVTTRTAGGVCTTHFDCSRTLYRHKDGIHRCLEKTDNGGVSCPILNYSYIDERQNIPDFQQLAAETYEYSEYNCGHSINSLCHCYDRHVANAFCNKKYSCSRCSPPQKGSVNAGYSDLIVNTLMPEGLVEFHNIKCCRDRHDSGSFQSSTESECNAFKNIKFNHSVPGHVYHQEMKYFEKKPVLSWMASSDAKLFMINFDGNSYYTEKTNIVIPNALRNYEGNITITPMTINEKTQTSCVGKGTELFFNSTALVTELIEVVNSDSGETEITASRTSPEKTSHSLSSSILPSEIESARSSSTGYSPIMFKLMTALIIRALCI